MSSFIRRAAFALRFGDFNPLVSGNITPSSKIIINRDIYARVTRDRTVPVVGRRRVPGHPQRPYAMDHRRLHDDGPLSVLAARHHRRRRRPVRAALQLRAQLGEGRHRRVRRHDHAVHRRQGRPDREGVLEGVPEPVLEVGSAPGHSPRTSAIPRTCSGRRRTCGAATTSTTPTPSTRTPTHGRLHPTPARRRRPARPSPRSTPTRRCRRRQPGASLRTTCC